MEVITEALPCSGGIGPGSCRGHLEVDPGQSEALGSHVGANGPRDSSAGPADGAFPDARGPARCRGDRPLPAGRDRLRGMEQAYRRRRRLSPATCCSTKCTCGWANHCSPSARPGPRLPRHRRIGGHQGLARRTRSRACPKTPAPSPLPETILLASSAPSEIPRIRPNCARVSTRPSHQPLTGMATSS